MCLTFDGVYLVCGDSQGLIYVWNISQEYTGSQLTSPRAGSLQDPKKEPTLHTFELHKDNGAITNLVCIHRPLSLYGLTANMKGYDPLGEIKPFQKVQNVMPFNPEISTQIVPLALRDYSTSNSGQQTLWDKIAENEEYDYIIRSSQRILNPKATQTNSIMQNLASKEDQQEVIPFTEANTANPSQMSEVERLREENKRLKRTLLERFDETFN